MSKKNPFDYPIFWEVRFVGSKKDKLTREDKAFYRTQVSRQFKTAYKTEAAAKAAITRNGNFHHLNLEASPVMFWSIADWTR